MKEWNKKEITSTSWWLSNLHLHLGLLWTSDSCDFLYCWHHHLEAIRHLKHNRFELEFSIPSPQYLPNLLCPRLLSLSEQYHLPSTCLSPNPRIILHSSFPLSLSSFISWISFFFFWLQIMKSLTNNSLNNEAIYCPTRILSVGRFQGCFSDITNNPVFPAFCSGILSELVTSSLLITRCLQQLQVSCLQLTLSWGRKRGVSSHISYYQGEKPFLKASLQTSPSSSLAPF